MDLLIFLHALTALFVIIDPIGTALIFNALTHGQNTRAKFTQALKASIISAVLLVLFGNYGADLLSYLGISINALKISGGVLLFYTAFQMINSELNFRMEDKVEDISVYPMSIPLLAGPGSLTVSILLFSSVTGSTDQLAIFMAVITICALTFLFMSCSVYLKNIVGKTGDEILRRFLGVLLAALAIQFILDGLSSILN
ncbi:MAG: multiple antibiotic resistance protein [Oleiphilaceae bacterium]